MTQGIWMDRSGWTYAGIEVNVTGIGSDTYGPYTSLGSDILNHRDVMDDLVTWCNAAARAWFGFITFSWASTDQSPQFGVSLIPTGTASYTVNSTMQGLTGWPASQAASGDPLNSTAGISGTCDASFRVPGWVPRVDGTGIHAEDGACLPDAPSTALKRLPVDAILTERQRLAMRAALTSGPTERAAYVYHEAAATWRYITFGDVRFERGSVDLYRASLEGVA